VNPTLTVGGVALAVETSATFNKPTRRKDGKGYLTQTVRHTLRACDACGEVTYVRKATKDRDKRCRMTPGCTGRYTRRAGDDNDHTNAA
jgi:hypothetical protein